MSNTFTPLLPLYLYNEATEEQQLQLAEALLTDEALKQELDDMLRAKKWLNRKQKSPSASSIRIIMQHSAQTEHLQEF